MRGNEITAYGIRVDLLLGCGLERSLAHAILAGTLLAGDWGDGARRLLGVGWRERAVVLRARGRGREEEGRLGGMRFFRDVRAVSRNVFHARRREDAKERDEKEKAGRYGGQVENVGDIGLEPGRLFRDMRVI